MRNSEITVREFIGLLNILDELREKCPWDKKQTNESLRKLTIEETYELAEAIISQDDNAICSELGDLLLHIVFYSKLGEEKGVFNINDVLTGIREKLIYRHPHVFGDTEVANDKEVLENWENLKTRENKEYKQVLSGVPVSLPATVKAIRIQEKAKGVGFDWEKPEQVWMKIREEYEELMTEINNKNNEGIEEEFGDLFFALINASRLYDIDPEAALEKCNRKFINRFNYIESETLKKGRALKEIPMSEMDALWEKAKELEKQ